MINDYVGRNGKTPAEGSLLELPVFDKKTVLKIYAKDLSLFSEVLEAYFLDIPNMVQTIREAIESWNSQKLAYSAHALKGAVSVLEAKRVYQVAKQLEFIGKSNTWENIHVVFHRLETEIAELDKTLILFQQEYHL